MHTLPHSIDWTYFRATDAYVWLSAALGFSESAFLIIEVLDGLCLICYFSVAKLTVCGCLSTGCAMVTELISAGSDISLRKKVLLGNWDNHFVHQDTLFILVYWYID